MTDKPDSLRSIYVEQPVHPAIAELHNKEPDTNAPKVYDEYGIVAGGITKQLISDAAKRSPLFGAGQIMSTPSDAPNPYYRHWNDSLECHAQTEMSQHGATSVAELPEMLQDAIMKQSDVSGDTQQPATPQRYGPIAGYPLLDAILTPQVAAPVDLPWNSRVVSCPKCGGLCTHVLLSLCAEDSDVVFRCLPCYEKYHAQKNVLPGSADRNELGPGSPADLPEAQPTARSQSPAWNVAPWVEPLSCAGTYSPTD